MYMYTAVCSSAVFVLFRMNSGPCLQSHRRKGLSPCDLCAPCPRRARPRRTSSGRKYIDPARIDPIVEKRHTARMMPPLVWAALAVAAASATHTASPKSFGVGRSQVVISSASETGPGRLGSWHCRISHPSPRPPSASPCCRP